MSNELHNRSRGFVRGAGELRETRQSDHPVGRQSLIRNSNPTTHRNAEMGSTGLPVSRSYLTTFDVCHLLSVSERTVREWMAVKKLPFFRIGRVVRFHPQAVEAFIQERTVKARFSRPCEAQTRNGVECGGSSRNVGEQGCNMRSSASPLNFNERRAA